ncbi:unnamed protein product, partial [Sphacelaria rigidula]
MRSYPAPPFSKKHPWSCVALCWLFRRTEQGVQEALNGLKTNRTTVVIAHRLSTIRNADQILVLSEGQV